MAINIEHKSNYLSYEEAQKIQDPNERVFALACLDKGLFLIHQYRVNGSVIDFLVINPRLNNNESLGTLVEVTFMSHNEINQSHLTKRINGKNRRIENKTGQRKQRQIISMQESGHKWTLIDRESITKIARSRNKKS